MASLLARLSWRGKREFDAGNGILNEPSQRRASSTRSRKSMSSLFRQSDSPLQPDCQERVHYPLYDPGNPEHHGPLASSESSTQGQPVTPKKSRLQIFAQGLQDALRAKASYFHIQPPPDSALPSPSSSISKKSVRFREGHLVIEDEGNATASPLTISPQNASPQLPKLNFSQTQLLPSFPAESCSQEELGNRCSPKTLSVTLPPPLTMLESPFDDIYATDDIERENRESLDDKVAMLVDIGNSTSTTIDEGRSNSSSNSPQCEHVEYPVAATLTVKSNSLPLRKSRVEIGRAEVYGVAAVPPGLENGLVASKRKRASDFD